MRRLMIVAALMLAAGHAIADEDTSAALAGGVADCVTTAAAFALTEVVELNPAGPIAACTIEPLLVREFNKLPEPDRIQHLHGLAATKWGAAANNVAVIAGVHGIAAPAIGAAVALVIWLRGADEREFMAQCALHERLSGHPMTCVYKEAQ